MRVFVLNDSLTLRPCVPGEEYLNGVQCRECKPGYYTSDGVSPSCVRLSVVLPRVVHLILRCSCRAGLASTQPRRPLLPALRARLAARTTPEARASASRFAYPLRSSASNLVFLCRSALWAAMRT